jgi:hypothetical protein
MRDKSLSVCAAPQHTPVPGQDAPGGAAWSAWQAAPEFNDPALEETIMLVTFTCPAYADITMFGDVAIRLLKLMGHSGTVPSALHAKDVQPSLEHLVAALEALEEPPVQQQPASQDEDEPAVTLHHRALPLIELLKAAADAECSVMWDKR